MTPISAKIRVPLLTGAKAMLLAALVCTPLLTISAVKAGTGAGIIEGTMEMSSGAGFVLMVSLQRMR